jgi:hypothetical protein
MAAKPKGHHFNSHSDTVSFDRASSEAFACLSGQESPGPLYRLLANSPAGEKCFSKMHAELRIPAPTLTWRDPQVEIELGRCAKTVAPSRHVLP